MRLIAALAPALAAAPSPLDRAQLLWEQEVAHLRAASLSPPVRRALRRVLESILREAGGNPELVASARSLLADLDRD